MATWVTKQLTRSVRSALTLHQQAQCIEGAFFKSMEPQKITNVTCIEKHQNHFSHRIFLLFTQCGTTKKKKSLCPKDLNRYNATSRSILTINTYHCVTSSGVTGILLPSYYCSSHYTKTSGNHIIIYSSLKTATNDAEHQPLYFRDEVIILSQIGTDIAFYRATFSRSQDLGMTTKYLLKNTVSSSQSNIRDGYYEWLQQ